MFSFLSRFKAKPKLPDNLTREELIYRVVMSVPFGSWKKASHYSSRLDSYLYGEPKKFTVKYKGLQLVLREYRILVERPYHEMIWHNPQTVALYRKLSEVEAQFERNEIQNRRIESENAYRRALNV